MEANSDLKSIIGDTLLKCKDGKIETVSFEDWQKEFAKGEYLCFYFGAHWAPPCRIFTTQLNETLYSKVNTEADGKKIEVIFVTHDREQSHFDRNFKLMPWMSIDFKDDHRRATLGSKFGVCELPTLVVCDKNGKLITHDARDGVAKGAKVLDEWKDLAEKANAPVEEAKQNEIVS